ncbi:MAG: SirB2 family protein [Bacteroidetes bacterium]|nr:SirB2 family protein [Bacteroidota bacterium]
MYTGMLHTHKLSVILFLVLYLIKTALLIFGKTELLTRVTKATRITEMIISTLFLATGIYLLIYTGNKGAWLWVKLIAVATSIPLAIMAFKKQNKNLALLSLIFIVYAYGVSESKNLMFSSAKPDLPAGTDLKAGEIIFANQCVNCHGSDGKLGLSGAKDLTASARTHAEKVEIVTHGKNAMQAYDKMLSAEQIEAVVSYVETLNK